LTEFSFIEKTSFSMMGDTDCVKALKDSGCRSVILCGIEAHVCVLQSALDLLDSGFDVFVIEDAVDSRQPADKSSAISRMSDAKAVVTTTEAILFELIGGARHPMFKEISKLVK
jgi:nicotinamidase-related amidase